MSIAIGWLGSREVADELRKVSAALADYEPDEDQVAELRATIEHWLKW